MQGATILERGIQYASEDRVGTAVMTQMFSSTRRQVDGDRHFAFDLWMLQWNAAGRRARLLRDGERWFVLSQRCQAASEYKTPAVSLIMQMVWTCVLCISGSYGQLLDYIIFAVLVFYILTILAIFVLRRTHPTAERPYKAFGYPVLPAIYIVMALFIDVVLLRYKPQYTWPGLIIVLLGIPVYFLWSRRSNTASAT